MPTGQKDDEPGGQAPLTGSGALPPLVSLCMIVRDEAELLPAFFTQAAGVWDELCVVDTGSTDGTIGILQAAGARIFERPWTGDFAAARNASLAQAKGEWILFLDADERMSRTLVAEIRALVADPNAGAATVAMQNRLPHGHERRARLLRLFRRDPEIHFRYRIHEEVATSVTAMLKRTGRRLHHLEGVVEHLGYVRERAVARNKKARDIDLLERSVADDPGDFYSWFKLFEQARFWDDPAIASKAAPLCLAALETRGLHALRNQPFGGELLSLLATAIFPENTARALELCEKWAPHLQPSAAFHLKRGELFEACGSIAEAEQNFRACLALEADTADIQLATVRPLMGLARLALAPPQGLERAWGFTERALGHNPRDPEALLSAVAICQTAGGAEMVEDLVRGYVKRHGETEELRTALKEATGRK